MKRQMILLSLLLSLCGTINAQLEDIYLRGTWVIEDFRMAPISAMDDAMASEWVGQKLIITEGIVMDFHQIPSYAEQFETNFCDHSEGQSKGIIKSHEYFKTQFKMSPDQIEIGEPELLIVRNNCPNTPFSQMLFTEDERMIIHWDGVFFFLRRS